MKVKLNSLYCSPRGVFHPGAVIDVSDEEGAQLIAGRYATAFVASEASKPAEPAPVIETAAVAAPENAAARTGRAGARNRTTAKP